MAGPRNVIQTGDYWRSIISCSDGGQRSFNTWDFYCFLASGGPVLDSDLAAWVDLNMGAAYPAVLNNSAQYDYTEVFRLWPLPPDTLDTVARPVRNVVSAGVGSAGATALPKQTSGLIIWLGTTRRKGGSGRKFIPFPSASDNLAIGAPSGGYTGRLNTIGSAPIPQVALTVGSGTALMIPAIVRVHRASKTSPWLLDADLATDNRNRDVWATQRRRGDLGRPNP